MSEFAFRGGRAEEAWEGRFGGELSVGLQLLGLQLFCSGPLALGCGGALGRW
jgi:hypothetical protein